MRWTMRATAFSLMLCLNMASACTPMMEEDADTDSSMNDTDESMNDTDESMNDTDESGEPGPTAIAFLRSQRPELADEGEADELLVDIANFELLCTAPDYYPECSKDAFWSLSLTFAAGQQQPGSYAAADLDAVILSQSSIDSPCERFAFELDATFEIISIDATELVIKISGETGIFADEIEGEYTVERC